MLPIHVDEVSGTINNKVEEQPLAGARAWVDSGTHQIFLVVEGPVFMWVEPIRLYRGPFSSNLNRKIELETRQSAATITTYGQRAQAEGP